MVDQPTSPASDPSTPRSGSLRRSLTALGHRVRASGPGLMVSVLGAALISTVLGAGAMGRADEMSDGAVWLWSSPLGESVRVNGNNGQIDLVAALPESAGNRVQVTQNDDYLLLLDPVTGRVTSIDLREMGFSGVLELGAGEDVSLALGEDTAVVIDHGAGEVRAVDPATLQPTGPSLRVPAPLVGGAFDDSDTLWLGVPTQGTVVGVKVQEEDATISQTASVADPGADIAVTVLDDGVLAVDRSGDGMVALRNGGEPRTLTSPIPLEGAEMPLRTRGDLAAVTIPESGDIVTVQDPGGSSTVGHLATGHEGGGIAVPHAGHLYVPYDEDGVVRAFQPSGEELNPITLPDAQGPLELETREGNLYINAPDSGVAAVVDQDGQARVIDKTAPPPGPGDEEDEDKPAPQGPRPNVPQPDQEDGTPQPDGESPRPGTPDPTDLAAPAPVTPAPADPPPPPDDDDEDETGVAPGAPTPVTATSGDGSVSLSWPEAYSPDAPVEEYAITWDGGSTTVAGTELGAGIDGLSNGTAYRFRVTATNEYGTGPAAQTPEVTPNTAAPGDPSNVTAEASGNDSATVSWSTADNAADYVITSVNTGGGAAPSDRTSTSSSVQVTGLTPGQTYTFTVTARGEGGVEGGSATSSPITMSSETVGAPSNVSHSVSGNQVTVTWTAAENAAQYRVTPGGGGGSALGGAVTVSGTSHTFTRGGGRCYSFTVTALGADGTEGDGSASSPGACVREFS
ncbi:fibronectin type III domain protein [Nocardiopsis sp. Huas11]|uniref:fibronectin type III domain-containing protein n=1 Tax=Nocardiopsis sp. Huas11 TaxID=2183912 RepID=UPI000EB481F6|nr:fibronectin type III domain-containing protein [Nocardiopsis sp. Huas11]RKS06176.1 fibronectin type III domain protein [Nocardiopsis sp. Huas11]